MNRAQKLAWFSICAIGIGIVLAGIVAYIILQFDLPVALNGGHVGAGMLAYLCIAALTSRFMIREKPGSVIFDERDEQIRKKALLVAYYVLWIVFLGVCFGLFFLLGPKGMIPAHLLPVMAAGSAADVILIHSITVLVLYGRSQKGEES